MRMMTSKLMEDGWVFLQSHQQLNGFKDRAEYLEHFKTLPEVDGDGSKTYWCRKISSKPFSSSNSKIVNIQFPDQIEEIISPAVGGFEYE